MKLLLDANLSWRLIPSLSEHFDECSHVNKTNLPKPAKDIEIWQFAAENDYIIITQDSDFLNLLESKGFPPKVILLRVGNMDKNMVKEILIQAKSSIIEFASSNFGLLEII